ncbi:MAG: AzlD domain-containing protein [Lachnospiraceae bacterium]|nr:AzlD domain-containing protein [Lachnospiraceae bacterium]
MNSQMSIIAIAIMAVITFLLRGLPFIIFREKKVPAYVAYLGKYLPFSMMAMLVVYCLKSTTVMAKPYGLPELISVLVVAGLHIWKKNTVLSVIAGTACYMLLIRIW